MTTKGVYDFLKNKTQLNYREVLEQSIFIHPTTGEEHSVSLDDFKISNSNFIGEGSFGAVFKAKYSGDETNIALKKIKFG